MRSRPDLFSAPVQSVSTPSICFNNMVIVRIWQGKNYSKGDVGHVSLAIPRFNLYASLHPGETARPGLPHIIKPVWYTLSQDTHEKEPEHIFYFFSLTIAAMSKHLKVRKERVVGWLLQGESSLVNADTDNCTTLVYGLLRAGGIDTLHSIRDTERMRGSSAGSSVTWIPNRLATYLPHVVLAERRDYPATHAFEAQALREGAIAIEAIEDPGESEEHHASEPRDDQTNFFRRRVPVPAEEDNGPVDHELLLATKEMRLTNLLPFSRFLFAATSIIFIAIFFLLLLPMIKGATASEFDFSPRRNR